MHCASIPPFLLRTHGLFVWHRTRRSCLRCPRRWPFTLISRSPLFIQSLLALWSRVFTMCPVRALRIYLRRIEHSRGPNRSLFVHWDKGRAHCPVSKPWISSCLTEAIRSTYRHQGREHEIIHVRYGAWQRPGLK